MKKRILTPLVFWPALLFAQKGIYFQNKHTYTWEQLKQKAKTENKYIFVDCFATWCGPCKLMDQEVYSADSVGEFFNKTFISVKVQCDTSKSDGDDVKAWYADAHQIVTENKITAYPTFLFFSPEGKLVHEDVGYQPTHDFLASGQAALNPHQQYYTLLERYQKGMKEYSEMPYLVSMAQKLSEKELSQSIAADYIRNYLDKLPDTAFLTKENITFIALSPPNLDSKERIFDWCFHQPAKIDTILHDKGFSGKVVNYVVYKEELIPPMMAAQASGSEPDWNAISKSIDHKFGSTFVEENVLTAQLRWYRNAQDWKKYIKFLIAKMDHDKVEQNTPKDFWGIVGLNSSAWDIFEHSDNKDELRKALIWSDIVIANAEPKSGHNYGEFIDTKANLLYKLGRKTEALALEAKAKEMTTNDKIQETYKKMQEGKPTW